MSEYLNNAKASIGNATQSIQQNLPNINEVTSQVSEGVNTLKQTAQTATADFSSKGAVDASQEFLNSNSMIARFVFVILILIAFMFLLNLGVSLVTYLVAPSQNPYIIHGMIPGTEYTVFPQDPTSKTAVIYRSNNQSGGIEFTWSVWLKVDSMPLDTNFHLIFVKGTDQYTSNGTATVNNGPGLYLHKNTNISDGSGSSQLNLRYLMDAVSPDSKGQYTPQEVVIPNLPIGKWFHVAFRMQNKTMDCYVNGVITTRASFGDLIPKQNYDPIVYAGNGGFAGSVSNLRYYSYALSVFEINSIVYYGPNLNAANGASSSYFDYLGQSWYSGNVPN